MWRPFATPDCRGFGRDSTRPWGCGTCPGCRRRIARSVAHARQGREYFRAPPEPLILEVVLGIIVGLLIRYWEVNERYVDAVMASPVALLSLLVAGLCLVDFELRRFAERVIVAA